MLPLPGYLKQFRSVQIDFFKKQITWMTDFDVKGLFVSLKLYIIKYLIKLIKYFIIYKARTILYLRRTAYIIMRISRMTRLKIKKAKRKSKSLGIRLGIYFKNNILIYFNRLTTDIALNVKNNINQIKFENIIIKIEQIHKLTSLNKLALLNKLLPYLKQYKVQVKYTAAIFITFMLFTQLYTNEDILSLRTELNLFSSNLPPSKHYAALTNQSGSTDSNSSIPIYVMVHSIETATLSSETAATIRFILRENDSFKKGDTLIEFDCRVQRAELKRAEAQEKIASSSYKSATKLSSYGSISDTELIKAEAEAEMATADVAKLTALVDKCIIKAPYNGAVSEALAHVGESLKPGDPLLKIVNSENLDLEMQVPSEWLKWLQVGSPFEFKIHELNKTVSAKVYKINPEINSVSQTIKVRGLLNKPEPGLLPGMSGVALFPDKGDNSG